MQDVTSYDQKSPVIEVARDRLAIMAGLCPMLERIPPKSDHFVVNSEVLYQVWCWNDIS